MIEVRTEVVATDVLYRQEMAEVIVESEHGDYTWGIYHASVADAQATRLREMFEVVAR